jgi:hypothetical protein
MSKELVNPASSDASYVTWTLRVGDWSLLVLIIFRMQKQYPVSIVAEKDSPNMSTNLQHYSLWISQMGKLVSYDAVFRKISKMQIRRIPLQQIWRSEFKVMRDIYKIIWGNCRNSVQQTSIYEPFVYLLRNEPNYLDISLNFRTLLIYILS